MRRMNTIGGHLRADPEGTLVAHADFAVLEKAVREIAAGEGIYGMQAREYKEIARAALAKLGLAA